jgi:hypothetical protein
MTYYCLKCDTTHSPVHDLYEEHKVYAIFPEEFGYPKVRELKEIAKHLRTLADKVIRDLIKLRPAKYEIYVSSRSFRNVLFSRMKAKVRNKPTFTQVDRNALQNRELGLIFTFVERKRPEMECVSYNGFQVCVREVAPVEVRKRVLKEKPTVDELISEIKKYENLAYVLGYDYRLSSDEYNALVTKTNYQLLESALKKMKRMVARRLHLLPILEDIFVRYYATAFVSEALKKLLDMGIPRDLALKIAVRYYYTQVLIYDPILAVKGFKRFSEKELGLPDVVVRKLLYPWSVWVQEKVQSVLSRLKSRRT